MGLTCRVDTVEASAACVEALESFFRFDFGRDFFRFWVDFGRVLGAQHGPKIDFWDVFFDVFFKHGFGIDFEPIFESSKP